MGAVTPGRARLMLRRGQGLFAACLSAALVSCASSENFAPVTDVSAYEAVIQSHASRAYVAKRPVVHHQQIVVSDNRDTGWSWPAAGVLLSSYSPKTKGIDMGGTIGQPVNAASSGRVVYAGGGLRGYGKLVIIKHDNQYLSVYAYNSMLFVRDGDWVKRGQRIADMGQNGSGQGILHFEIRKQGKPVNPLNFIS